MNYRLAPGSGQRLQLRDWWRDRCRRRRNVGGVHVVDDNGARLGDLEELVRRIVVPLCTVSDTVVAEIKIPAIEALVAHADDGVIALIADDVRVHSRLLRLAQYAQARSLVGFGLALAQDWEKRMRNVVCCALVWVDEARWTEVEVIADETLVADTADGL